MPGTIYILINKVNGKSYVGQSWDVEQRFKEHARCHGQGAVLRKAMNKYAFAGFEKHLLFQGIEDQDTMDLAEDWAIWFNRSMIPTGYNLKGGGQKGDHSPELIERIRQKNILVHGTPEMRAKKSEMAKRQWQEKRETMMAAMNIAEVKDKRRAKQKIAFSTPKNKRRRAELIRDRWKDPEYAKRQIFIHARPVLDTSTGEIYPSIGAACRATHTSHSRISEMCSGTRIPRTGKRFEYATVKPA